MFTMYWKLHLLQTYDKKCRCKLKNVWGGKWFYNILLWGILSRKFLKTLSPTGSKSKLVSVPFWIRDGDGQIQGEAFGLVEWRVEQGKQWGGKRLGKRGWSRPWRWSLEDSQRPPPKRVWPPDQPPTPHSHFQVQIKFNIFSLQMDAPPKPLGLPWWSSG